MNRVLRTFVLATAIFGSAAALAAQQPQPGKDLHGDLLPPGTLARMGTHRLRPGATAHHLLFSSDGKQLICFAGYNPNRVLISCDV